MRQYRTLSPRKVSRILLYWLGATNVLVWLSYATNLWLFKVVLLASLCFLPGVALLRLMRISLGTATSLVLYSFGLSILVLMVSGLAANQVLHVFGVERPLELPGVLGTWNVLALLCIWGNVRYGRKAVRLKRITRIRFSGYEQAVVAGSLLLPCLAVFGAFRLNNNGGAEVAMVALCYAAALIVYVFLARQRLSDGIIAWFIFTLGLSVLLMTSMRGWDIVGHDIEREFRVYTLTHTHGFWNIALDRSPYNACLSITILPEVFAKLMHVSGLVVFKVILQVIFAACPVALYVLIRQYAGKLGALTGVLLFISYPTFINDSAMLTRQGVAYVFFALSLLILSNKAQHPRYKLLFILCAMGAIWSHYSTAYMFVGLFTIAVICKRSIMWWQSRDGGQITVITNTVLSPLFATLLVLMTFVWYNQVTETSGGLTKTLHASVVNIPKLFSGDTNDKSSDVSSALLFSGSKTQVDLYTMYLEKSRTVGNADDLRYTPTLTSDDLPLTPVGKAVYSMGFNPAYIAVLRQNFAKILQLLALAGVVFVVYRAWRKRPGVIDFDYICLNVAGLFLLALIVVLPILSINYGILRAFQQSLIFLILPITLFLVWLGRRLTPRLRVMCATFGISSLFLLFTGFFAQVLGGNSPPLTLNNSGLYYGLYHSSLADSQSFAWLKNYLPPAGDVRAANFNRATMHDPDYPFKTPGILPTQLKDESYVYLDEAQVQKHRMYTYYDSSPLVMTFPLDFYDDTMNRIYSTGTTRVYK